MDSNRWLLAGACITGLCIGWIAGKSTVPAGPETSEADAGEIAAAGRPVGRPRASRSAASGNELLAELLRGRTLQEFADEDLSELLVKLTKYDPSQDPLTRARQQYQLQLLLSKLPVARLEQMAVTAAADPEATRNQLLRTVFGAFARRDPARAYAWADAQPNPSRFQSMVIASMAEGDPYGAGELYRNALLEGTIGRNDMWQASHSLANATAKLGKDALLDLVDQLPAHLQSNLVSNVYDQLPEGDRLGLIEEIYRRHKTGEIQEYGFRNLFSRLASSDPRQAGEWLERMEPGRERATLEFTQGANFLQSGDAATAREWMSRAIGQMQGNEKELIDHAMNMAYNNPDGLALFSSLLPAEVELKAEDLKNHARNSMFQGMGGLADLAKTLRDPAEQATLMADALTGLASQGGGRSRINHNDFEIFGRRLADLNLTGEDAVRVNEALAAAREAALAPRE